MKNNICYLLIILVLLILAFSKPLTEKYSSLLVSKGKCTLKAEDNSLTICKYNANNVTPEMFGAVGDGVHDDSGAIKKALHSGKQVIFDRNKIYLIKNSITIEKSSNIDFNNSTMIFGASINFSPKEEYIGKYDYISKSSQIINYNCENGIFRLISADEMYSDSKKQYKLGFSSVVNNNVLVSPFDYNCSGDAYYIKKTRVIIKNIGDIKPYNNYENNCFNFYGCFVDINNITASNYKAMTLFNCVYSKVNVKNVNIFSDKRPKDHNFYYGFIIAACSDWNFENIRGTSFWHVITTGGKCGVSYNGMIKNSVFKAVEKCGKRMFAYVEHENSYDTTLLNVISEGVVINSGRIEECTILGNSKYDALNVTTSYYPKYARNITINKSQVKLNSIFRRSLRDEKGYYGDVRFNGCSIYVDRFINVGSNSNFCGENMLFRECDFVSNKAIVGCSNNENLHFKNIFFSKCKFKAPTFFYNINKNLKVVMDNDV